MASTSHSSWKRTLTSLAVVIAVIAAVLPPVIVFALKYENQKTAIEVDVKNVAQSINDVVNKDPQYWQFQQYVLDTFVTKRRDAHPKEQRIIRDGKGEILAESRDALSAPFISYAEPIYSAGQQVGQIEFIRTIQPVVLNTAFVAMLSLIFGMAVFLIMRALPLRILNETFTRLYNEKERAQTTLQSIGDAVITTDSEMRVEYLNPVAEELTGWKTEEVVGRPMIEIFNIVNEETREIVHNPIQTALAENRIVEMANHTVLIRRDGKEFHIEDSAAPIRGTDGKIVGAVMVFHDVSDRKQVQKNLDHMAHHDSLTGLPNRVLFNQRLQQSLALNQRRKQSTTLMFIDLDRFKTINDSLGHMVGDKLLLTVADRLCQAVRTEDTVARLGGDEFTIILEGVNEVGNAATVAEKILAVLTEPLVIEGHELFISASIGIAVSSADVDFETLIKNADTAMYRAKELGRNNYQFFETSMNEEVVERLHLENALRQALLRDEFRLFYQPKMDLRNNRVESVEALLRWNHPERGMVYPNLFIPILEETGLIKEVGEWVIREACRQVKEWQAKGMNLRIAVNVSAKQLQVKNFGEMVRCILQEYDLSGKFLEFEITESVFLSNSDDLGIILKSLHAQDILVSLDDFGTGYSSLGYLKRFPIGKLKIDKSFIDDVTVGKGDKALVEGLIVMAHALSMEVVAEGVETEGQQNLLRQIGCDVVQGYFISRPLDTDYFADWMRNYQGLIREREAALRQEPVLHAKTVVE